MRVRTLAEAAGFSRAHLTRVFHSLLAESPADLERRLRLEKSAFNLREAGISVLEASRDAGYATPEAFSRAFRAAYGMLPSEFRSDRITDWKLPCASNVHWNSGGTISEFVVASPDSGRYSVIERPAVTMAALRFAGEAASWYDAWQALEASLPEELRNNPAFRPTMLHFETHRAYRKRKPRVEIAIPIPQDMAMPLSLRILQVPGGVFAMQRELVDETKRRDALTDIAENWLPKSSTSRSAYPVVLEVFNDWPHRNTKTKSQLMVGLDLGISMA